MHMLQNSLRSSTEKPMAIRTVQVGEQVQCLLSSKSSTLSLESLSTISTSDSLIKSPPHTLAIICAFADITTALSTITMDDYQFSYESQKDKGLFGA